MKTSQAVDDFFTYNQANLKKNTAKNYQYCSLGSARSSEIGRQEP